MSDLLKSINTMIDDAIASENNTINIYTRLADAYEKLGNEKFEDAATIYRPNLFIFMQDIKTHQDVLNNLKFVIESRLDAKYQKESKNKIDRWNEAIKKIPLKDEYPLEGIETWHVSHHEMIPNSADVHNPLFKEDAIKLMVSGFDLAINDTYGTGSIIVTDNGFDIELWQYQNKKVVHENTLDEVIDWLINFYETGEA
jgi:hypothetical protein